MSCCHVLVSAHLLQSDSPHLVYLDSVAGGGVYDISVRSMNVDDRPTDRPTDDPPHISENFKWP